MSYHGKEGKNVFSSYKFEFPRAVCASHGNHDVGVSYREGARSGWVSGNFPDSMVDIIYFLLL